MIGDHVKGQKALDSFPEDIRRGIQLHRAIDQYTDTHPALQEAKMLFRPVYGLYSGAITDTLMDYFLANDPVLFPSAEDLGRFAQEVYDMLETRQQYFPPSFRAYFSSMKEHDWLTNYRSYMGISNSLKGLYRRAKHMPEPSDAYQVLRTEETVLNTYYKSFIGDVISFVKIRPSGG